MNNNILAIQNSVLLSIQFSLCLKYINVRYTTKVTPLSSERKHTHVSMIGCCVNPGGNQHAANRNLITFNECMYTNMYRAILKISKSFHLRFTDCKTLDCADVETKDIVQYRVLAKPD